MSYKGFVKAISRLPHTVTKAAGYAQETQDPEFNLLNEQFNSLDSLSKKLSDDAGKFKDALSSMLSHQAIFGETLMDAFGPLTPLGDARVSVVGTDLQHARDQVKEFTESMTRIKDLVLWY